MKITALDLDELDVGDCLVEITALDLDELDAGDCLVEITALDLDELDAGDCLVGGGGCSHLHQLSRADRASLHIW